MSSYRSNLKDSKTFKELEYCSIPKAKDMVQFTTDGYPPYKLSYTTTKAVKKCFIRNILVIFYHHLYCIENLELKHVI